MSIEQDFETVHASIGGVSAEQQGQALAALSRIEAEVERLRAALESIANQPAEGRGTYWMKQVARQALEKK
jgi:archaellum component FlaC